MTPDEKTALVATAGKRLEGLLGRPLTVQWPTPGDQITIDERMEEIAQRWCVSPLKLVHLTPESDLAGPDRATALSLAIDKAAGGGVTPSPKAMARAYYSLEGVRYRLWRLTRRTHPDLSEAQVAELVTEANRPDAIDALESLLKGLNPN